MAHDRANDPSRRPNLSPEAQARQDARRDMRDVNGIMHPERVLRRDYYTGKPTQVVPEHPSTEDRSVHNGEEGCPICVAEVKRGEK